MEHNSILSMLGLILAQVPKHIGKLQYVHFSYEPMYNLVIEPVLQKYNLFSLRSCLKRPVFPLIVWFKCTSMKTIGHMYSENKMFCLL